MTHSGLLNSAYLSTVVVGKREGLRMIANPIPNFHIMGFSSGILIPLLMGTTIVFPFFFPDTLYLMKAIQAYKCNTMRGTPTQYVGNKLTLTLNKLIKIFKFKIFFFIEINFLN